MADFNSLAAFASHLMRLEVTEALALHHGLEVVAARVEKDARDEIGHYQQAAGAFPAWQQLADSTEKEKARLGYPQDAPLLRIGNLRDSISHEVGALEAIVGSPDEVLVYQEIGTQHIPPRPVLGPALYHNQKMVQKVLGAALASGLLGHQKITPNLGYDYEID